MFAQRSSSIVMSDPYLPDGFDKWLKDAPKAAFLLDFDGTMVHLASHPDEVIVPQELINNLKIISQNGALSFAIVTGRALHRLDALMGGMTTVAVGSHGAEWRRRPDAEIEILAPPISPALRQILNKIAIDHDCIFEDKIYTISMHLPYEQMHKDLTPELVAATEDAGDYIVRKIGRTYEVLQKNIHKGFGIQHVMQQPGFAGKWPIYIGDDVGTDETLEVIKDLGGLCLGVSNHADGEKSNSKDLMGIDSVSWIVRSLAQYIAF
jgi:trehalose 6-phosphate phosphatase